MRRSTRLNNGKSQQAIVPGSATALEDRSAGDGDGIKRKAIMHKEIEIDEDELSVGQALLKTRLIVDYTMGDNGVEYSRISSGDYWNEDRREWVVMGAKLTDTIYNAHWKELEEKIMEREIDDHEFYLEMQQMKRDYEREIVGGLRRQLAGRC